MKVLFIATLALAPLAGLTASLGHEEAPRQSSQWSELRLTALGLGPAGGVDASDASCVRIRAEGAASVLSGRAELRLLDDIGPSRLALEAVAPQAGRSLVSGVAPLAMELRPFTLAHRDEHAEVSVSLAEGSIAAAVGKRVGLTLTLHHVGAPLALAVDACA